MALELLLLLLLLLVATLLLREGALLTVLLLVLLVEGRFTTCFWVLEVLRCTDLLWFLFSGFLYVVLLVTVLLRGLCVTVLFVTAFRCGDLTVVDLWVTVLLADGLASFLRTGLLSMFFDRSTAVLPATFPFERLFRIPEFLVTSPFLVLDLYDLYESLFRATFLLLR